MKTKQKQNDMTVEKIEGMIEQNQEAKLKINTLSLEYQNQFQNISKQNVSNLLSLQNIMFKKYGIQVYCRYWLNCGKDLEEQFKKLNQQRKLQLLLLMCKNQCIEKKLQVQASFIAVILKMLQQFKATKISKTNQKSQFKQKSKETKSNQQSNKRKVSNCKISNNKVTTKEQTYSQKFGYDWLHMIAQKIYNYKIEINMQELIKCLEDYNKNSNELFTTCISRFTISSVQEKQTLNMMCARKLKKTFEHIIKRNSEEDYIIILRNLLLSLFHGHSRDIIKLNLILGFIDDIFDCLSLKSLRSLFEIVENEMIKIKKIQEGDQNSMLRITNGMLKRISRAQDIQFRGRLHIALSRILKLCHDSGLNGKSISVSNIQIDNAEDTNYANKIIEFQQEGVPVSYRFYQKFWGLQKYFCDWNTLFNEALTDANILEDDEVNQGKVKGYKMSILKIKAIEAIVSEIVRIFANNPIKAYNHNSHQPTKYLTRSSLLVTQLNDSYFRKLFLIQGILFTYNLKNLSSKSGVTLAEQEKNVLIEIQRKIRDALNQQSKNLQDPSLVAKIEPFLLNERYWIDLKESWKEKKKTFFKKINSEFKSNIQYLYGNYDTEDEEKKNTYNELINPTCLKTVQKQMKIYSELMQKMKIEGMEFLQFIKQENSQKKNLQTNALVPSFEYYYEQAVNALQNFQKNGDIKQNFEQKNLYTIYEWKAMKALYKQNLKEVLSDRKDPIAHKFKQYRLLSIIKKREEEAKEGLKKVKLD